MTVSDFQMMSKGAMNTESGHADGKPHDFTYVVADDNSTQFHAFFDERETWITHRDNGQVLNIDAEMVKRLSSKNIA